MYGVSVPFPGIRDRWVGEYMKGQDIGVLLKLMCLQRHESRQKAVAAWPHDWKDWDSFEEDPLGETAEQVDPDAGIISPSRYTARSLEMQTGISKTQINRSLKHRMDIGLARNDRKLNVPRANTKALMEFIVYGLKYVFPARPGESDRACHGAGRLRPPTRTAYPARLSAQPKRGGYADLCYEAGRIACRLHA